MLVDINLLPKKESKGRLFYMLLVFLFITGGATGYVLFQEIGSVKQDVAELQSEIQDVQLEQARIQKKVDSQEDLKRFAGMENWINTIEQNRLSNVALIGVLSKLLPKQASFQLFSYQEGTVTLEIQVNSEMDAAYYYEYLKRQPWTDEVKLLQVESSGDSLNGDVQTDIYRAFFEIKVNLSL
ncbi:MAG: hypothetical protein H0Z32_11725 [Bacillaceae bacterium]|nr:hypothetical protein [Bacillaceae bacterium]